MSSSHASGLRGDQPLFIRIESLSKSFREGTDTRLVLRNVSLELSRGESVSIVGRSGSGKTTLLNLISGIESADGGSIWLNGTDLTSLGEHERTLFRRQHVGFIFQSFNLMPTLSVAENVMLPLELNGLRGREAELCAARVLEGVGLADRMGTFPDRLSGGEQQRVAIARALVHEPLLVLADEPTGNLDRETGWLVLDLLDRLTRQSGRNLVLVTHSREAAAIADRTLQLQDGTLAHV